VSLAREVGFACDAGANGVAFPGFASEWWKLTEDEIDRAAEIVIAAAGSRIPVILNITAQATCHAVAAAQRFTRMGCQGLMCLPPFVGGTTGSETFRHVARVLESSSLPFMLQWSPSLAGTGIEWPDLAKLERRFPHCQAIKVDFAPPAPTVTRLVAEFGREPNGALVLPPEPFTNVHRKRIVELATVHKFPIVSALRSFAEEGGLIAYGVNIPALFRQSAEYVDRILKGGKPADMPVERPTKFELAINMKTAKAIGLTIPQPLLLRADELIQ